VARNATLLDCLGTTIDLDTRSKILTAEEARQRLDKQAVCWVSGHFDPLLAIHAAHLKTFTAPGQVLVAEITNSLQPLLAQRARAELVAALAFVDYVVLSDKPPVSSADEAITERFVQHVLSRHRKEVAG
jgi:bifunctional ADP-heptose synthase (sugar kinase/adenylyltransferase)